MHPRTVKMVRRSLIGVVVVVALAVLANYLHVRAQRGRAAKKSARVLGPEMIRSFEGFEYSDTPNGVLRFRFRAKRLVDTQGGKSIVEGIEAFDYNPDGSVRNEIRSRNAVYDREHNAADFSGDVRLFLGDAFELRMNALYYDFNSKIAETHDRVRFISPALSGTARGVRFNQASKTLDLRSEIDFTVSARAAGAHEDTRFHAVSDSARCIDELRRVVFAGRARVESATGTLEADRITAALSADRERLETLTAEGNAAYESGPGRAGQSLRGGKMKFGIGGKLSLERIVVTGKAAFAARTADGSETLEAEEIEVLLDAAGGGPVRIEGRGGALLERSRGGERARVSGDRLEAAFASGSSRLESVRVRDPVRAVLTLSGPSGSDRNELRAGDIRMRFREAEGRAVFDRLHAEGSVRWLSGDTRANAPKRREPARTLEASSLEMVFSGDGGSLEEGIAAGRVTVSEEKEIAGRRSQISRLLADSMQFHFFPGDNRIRDLEASGRVQAVYEKAGGGEERTGAGRLLASSERMRVLFALENGESVVASASQWGNFVYTDASRTAMAGRCDYDAATGLLTLRESPRIDEATSSTTADAMEYSLAKRVLAVRGRVRSLLRAGKDSGSLPILAAPTAVLPAGTLDYRTDKRLLRYAGKVHVLSESGRLEAATLDVIDGGARVQARGFVRHTIPKRKDPEKAERSDKPKETRSSLNEDMTILSSSLEYERGKNTATYAGGVRVLSGSLSLESQALEAVISKSGQGLEKAVARREVHIRQDDVEGTGDTVDYYLEPPRFVLTGKPAVIEAPGRGRTSAPRLTYSIADDRILFGNR